VKDFIIYRHITHKKLFSFGNDISSVPVCGKTLSERQREAVEANLCQLVDMEDEREITTQQYMVFDDDLFFTSEFVKQALKSVGTDDCSLQFCLEKNEFNDRYVLPHSTQSEENLRFAFYFRNSNKPGLQLVEIKQKLYDHSISLPSQIVSSGSYYFGRTDCFISRIASPFHLLQVNLAFNLIRTITFQRRFPGWLGERFSKPENRYYFRVLKKMNRIGRNCQIHPTAVIEASELGDNVIVGAHAVVRYSHIGSGCQLSDNVAVVYCVLGQNNAISNSNYLACDLFFDNVFVINGPYQFSVFGNHAAVFAVINCDIRMDQQNIRIPTDVGILDSNQSLLGIAYGHHAWVGGGNIVAPGRIIPNYCVVNPPGHIIK
jgi:hypothetical protein